MRLLGLRCWWNSRNGAAVSAWDLALLLWDGKVLIPKWAAPSCEWCHQELPAGRKKFCSRYCGEQHYNKRMREVSAFRRTQLKAA